MAEDLEINKLKLKLWEKEFRNKNGSKPTKDDIKNAPNDIKDAYKQYWNLRSSRNSNSDTSKNETSDIKKHSCDESSLNSNIKEDNVWGNHLNKSTSTPVIDKTSVKSRLNHYALKLQANESLKKYELKKLSSGRFSQNSLNATSSSSQLQGVGPEENNDKCSINLPAEDFQKLGNTVKLGFLNGMKVVSKASSIVSSPNIQAVNAVSRLLNPENRLSTVKKRTIERSWLDRCNPENQIIHKNSGNDYMTDIHEKEHHSDSNCSFTENKASQDESEPQPTTNSDFCNKDIKHMQSFSPLDELEFKSTLFSRNCEFLKDRESLISLSSNNSILKDSLSDSEVPKKQLVISSPKCSVTLSKILESDNETKNNSFLSNKQPSTTKSINNKNIHLFQISDDAQLENKDSFSNFNSDPENCDSFNDHLDINCNNESLEKNITENEDILDNRITNKFSKKRKRKEIPCDELQLNGQESPIIKPKKRRCSSPASMVSSGNSKSNGKKLENLKKNLSSGRANENFVRINLKKKIFLRGKKTFSSRKYKRKQWLQLKQQRNDNGEPVTKRNTCFKCGEIGHWARSCPGKFKAKVESFAENTENPEIEESPFLTLEEAAALSKGIKTSQNVSVMYNSEPKDTYIENMDDDFTEAELKSLEITEQPMSDSYLLESTPDIDSKSIKPLISPDTSEIPDFVYSALRKFGYEKFRPGQEEAVRRILCGLSTLVILSTGAGKSLCYQLPAYLYAQREHCITLVISPLVSLMEDQIVGLPACLKAACLHTNLTNSQKQSVHNDIANGKIHVLLISPEAAVSGGEGGSGCLPKDLPPIAFACIDEAHCVSEWSHNFRPSYLRLCKVLREKLGIKCILGLTATATQATSCNIAHHFGIPEDSSSIIRGTIIPNNLILTCSRDRSKDEAIIELLKSEKFSQLESIIIYCIRRVQTERIACLIRTNFQDVTEFERKGKRRGRALSWNAEAYHAGMTAAKRRAVQNSFMSGKLRIVVATVAFGMGLDKSDVRAVIHYNMPKSFESYCQEIGRAGRDGQPAFCHVFLESQGEDIFELRRHIYSNSVDRSSLRKLIKKIFHPCICHKIEEKLNQMKKSIIANNETCVVDCKEADEDDEKKNKELPLKQKQCPGHEIAIPIEPLIQELDLKEESIETLLCYLELSNKHLLKQLTPVYATCKVKCYGGNKQLKAASRKCPPLAVAIALDRQRNISHEKSTEIEFPVVEIASRMGWNSGIVKRELKALEWNNELLAGGGKIRRSGILVEFCDLAFHLQTLRKVEEEELDEVLDFLNDRIVVQEKTQLYQLKRIYEALKSVSKPFVWDCYEVIEAECSNKLKKEITSYFDLANSLPVEHSDLINMKQKLNSLDDKEDVKPCKKEDHVRRDICNFLSTYHDQSFNGRSVARIFWGIPSPCYPSDVWGRVRRYWRCHMDVDFNLLSQWAIQEIRKFK